MNLKIILEGLSGLLKDWGLIKDYELINDVLLYCLSECTRMISLARDALDLLAILEAKNRNLNFVSKELIGKVKDKLLLIVESAGYITQATNRVKLKKPIFITFFYLFIIKLQLSSNINI
jgi:hypothetical protein